MDESRYRNSVQRIAELDGVRGIAILLVLYWHYADRLLVTLVEHGYQGKWPILTYIGYSHRLTWSGVDLFFVLSGFLIVGILLDVKDSKFYFKTFYMRRICRIIPLYYLMLFLFIIIPWLGLQSTKGLFEGNFPLYSYFTFTQNFFIHGSGSMWLIVAWSLAIEEQFYLVVPLLVKFTNRKNLLLIFGCAICMAPFLRFMPGGVEAMPFGRSDSILMGGLIAIVIRDVRLREVLIINYRYIVFLFVSFFIGTAIWSTCHFAYLGYGTAFIHLWFGILYSLFIIVVILNRSTSLSFVLKNNLLVWFGLRSYAVYLFHMPMKTIVYYYLSNIMPLAYFHYVDYLTPVVSLIIVLILSELSFRYYENRFLLFGKTFKY